MNKSNPIVGIDIGTTKIAVCVGEVREGILTVTSLVKTINSGMRKGEIIDLDDTVSAISSVLQLAEQECQTQISNAFVGIGGAHISTLVSRGTVAVSKPNGEITQVDIDRVIETSRVIALPANKEIIHVIPKYFIIDGQEETKDPIGLTGVRLEVESLIVAGSSNSIRNLTRSVSQAGITLDGLLFSPLATGHALLDKKQKETGVILVDLGGGTTSIAVYEEKDMVHSAIIPLGSVSITNDIARGLKTSLENAEQIKIKYGTADVEKVKSTEKIHMNKFDPDDDNVYDRKFLSEIIEARVKEIFEIIIKELRNIDKDGLLPAGIVFTGGGANLDGIIELAKHELQLPAQIGKPNLEISGSVNNLDDPDYSTALGLMLDGYDQLGNGGFSFSLPKGNVTDILSTAKGWLQKFLP